MLIWSGKNFDILAYPIQKWFVYFKCTLLMISDNFHILSTLGSKFLKTIGHTLLRDVLIMLLLDFFIFIAMMIIPAAMVPNNSNFGNSSYYGGK